MNKPDLSQMFQAPLSQIRENIESMAAACAVEDENIRLMEKQLADRKKQRDKAKEDLARLLIQNGMESVKLANGLTPRAVVKQRIFKAAGVSDESVFNWLEDNDLDGIIRPSVHFKTLDNTLKQYRENGGRIPEELFNQSEQLTVNIYNKSKFLAQRQP